jgi:6-pyruvoyltetrahydropterin/6-carboxytetrahydropterin synthase
VSASAPNERNSGVTGEEKGRILSPMKYSIRKEFHFEACHRLTAPYHGKCSHLHGHSFVVHISVAATELDERGFVMDFNELKPLKDWIDSELDHATLVSENDRSLIEWLKANGQKYVLFPVNPTSEIIARAIAEKAKSLGFPLAAVEIAETCTSSAKVEF